MPITAIIFDFDGVILETESPIHQSWSELYQEFGLKLSMEVWARTIGAGEDIFDPLADIEEQVGRLPDRERLARRRRQREDALVAAQPVMPGVAQMLHDARRMGLRVALASSSSCRWVVGHLERLGLRDYFSIIRASDDVERTKPDPELYLSALAGLGVDSTQAFAIEDSPNGVSAARHAGLFCVAVPNNLTRGLPLEHADMLLESLASLPLDRLVAEIERRLNGNHS